MRFQTNTIVSHINLRISDRYTITIYNIESIIVAESTAVNCEAVYLQIFTLIIGLYPCSAVAQRYTFNQNILAGTEIDHHGSYFNFRTIITECVFDKSFMNQSSHIIRYL